MERINPIHYSVTIGTPVLEALKKVNIPPLYVSLIVDHENCLKGILTDGDFRRGLLNGYDLNNAVDVFMKSDPITALNTITWENAEDLLRRENLTCLPLVSHDGKLEAVMTSASLPQESQEDKVAVIMAGGKGSRLYPLTKDCPKPMLKIHGKPILEILIEQCMRAGFAKFYISVNYLKDHIIDYFGNGEKKGVSIDYLIEDQPMGTAGSLQLLPRTIRNPFLVLNGDVLTNLDYSHVMRFHANHKQAATMCVREHLTQIPFGVVQTDGHRLIRFDEKPTYRQYVNAGVYVIDPSILAFLERDVSTDMPMLLVAAQDSDCQVVICPIHEYWLDIGMPETLHVAQTEWTDFASK